MIPIYYMFIDNWGVLGAAFGKVTAGGVIYLVTLVIFKRFQKNNYEL